MRIYFENYLVDSKINEYFFGILLDLPYLCIMKTKNLYLNIGLLMHNVLVFSMLYPPQFRYRTQRQTLSLEFGKAPLLLSAPAFSGRDFRVKPFK